MEIGNFLPFRFGENHVLTVSVSMKPSWQRLLQHQFRVNNFLPVPIYRKPFLGNANLEKTFLGRPFH
jgi:hypothetical protein